jgi:hypothetical protein
MVRESYAERGYTVVRHSGYGYGHSTDFMRGLETRGVATAAEAEQIRRAGGIIFATYAEAVRYEETAPYPPGHEGLIPRAPGTFSTVMVDGLAVYLPPKCRCCGVAIRLTGDDGVPWVHQGTGNGFCDVSGPADAVEHRGRAGRTVAEPATRSHGVID